MSRSSATAQSLVERFSDFSGEDYQIAIAAGLAVPLFKTMGSARFLEVSGTLSSKRVVWCAVHDLALAGAHDMAAELAFSAVSLPHNDRTWTMYIAVMKSAFRVWKRGSQPDLLDVRLFERDPLEQVCDLLQTVEPAKILENIELE